MGYAIKQDTTNVNKGSAGANRPEWIIFHFVGATGQAQSNANYFKSIYRGASAHYFVDKTSIIQVVEDNRPAWHVGDGSRGSGKYNGYKGYGATNNNSIGIEFCQDTSTGKDVWHWDFHAETMKRGEWLIRQLQEKYNIPDSRVIRHYDVSGKMCPGNWQWNGWAKWNSFKAKLAGVADRPVVGGGSTNEGKPTVNGKTYLVQAGDTLSAIAKKHGVTLNNLVEWNDLDNPNIIFPETYLFVGQPKQEAPKDSIDKMAQDTIKGLYGSGDARRAKLGSDYNAVQSRVNDILTGKGTTPKPETKSIDTLVKETIAGKHGNGDARKNSLGSNYDAVMAVINGTGGIVSKPVGKSIDTLVKETLAGKHGNGDVRKKSLGSNYNAVMAKINGKSPSVSKPASKSITELVKETMAGKHGNGDVRKKSLGSNYNAVMNAINGKTKPANKGIPSSVVDAVIAGKYGNGKDRELKLRNAGYDPNEVQKLVNKRF